MTTIHLNDKPLSITKGMGLNELLKQEFASDGPYAVAINGEFVPRSTYPETTLNDGDRLDVVSPVGGG